MTKNEIDPVLCKREIQVNQFEKNVNTNYFKACALGTMHVPASTVKKYNRLRKEINRKICDFLSQFNLIDGSNQHNQPTSFCVGADMISGP